VDCTLEFLACGTGAGGETDELVGVAVDQSKRVSCGKWDGKPLRSKNVVENGMQVRERGGGRWKVGCDTAPRASTNKHEDLQPETQDYQMVTWLLPTIRVRCGVVEVICKVLKLCFTRSILQGTKTVAEDVISTRRHG
jgi:hypothetical protein